MVIYNIDITDSMTDSENIFGDVGGIDLENIESENTDIQSSLPSYNILTYPTDFTLEILCQKLETEEIIIPRFQRNYVWTLNQASKLIESFLAGLPVPPIYLYRENESNKYGVIDGQQRLITVLKYFSGVFNEDKIGKTFKLSGLNENSKWNNLSYRDLPEEDKRQLNNSVLRSFIVQQLAPNDNDSSIYHIFERLNTGGTSLRPQEIRNCIYYGSFADLLKKLNLNENWRKILGDDKPDIRLKDIELILRFFSLFFESNAYTKPMKDFLSNFMRKNRDLDTTQLNTFEEIFTNTCDIVIRQIGDRPFRIHKGINVAIMDSVMVVISQYIDKLPQNIAERYITLIKDQRYLKNVNTGTTDAKIIETRLEIAKRILID